MKNFNIICFFLIFIATSSLLAQIRIKEFPINDPISYDSSFFDISRFRQTVNLNRNWEIFLEENPLNRSTVTVPSIFEGSESLIYETSFNLTKEQIRNNYIYLYFLGLSYSAEISINDLTIYKSSNAQIPFTLALQQDILTSVSPNKLRVKLEYNLDTKSTIPFSMNFLSPLTRGGIFREVFLQFIPRTSIQAINTRIEPDKNFNSLNINFEINLRDLSVPAVTDTEPAADKNFTVSLHILSSEKVILKSILGEKLNFDESGKAKTNLSIDFKITFSEESI